MPWTPSPTTYRTRHCCTSWPCQGLPAARQSAQSRATKDLNTWSRPRMTPYVQAGRMPSMSCGSRGRFARSAASRYMPSRSAGSGACSAATSRRASSRTRIRLASCCTSRSCSGDRLATGSGCDVSSDCTSSRAMRAIDSSVALTVASSILRLPASRYRLAVALLYASPRFAHGAFVTSSASASATSLNLSTPACRLLALTVTTPSRRQSPRWRRGSRVRARR